MKTKTDLDRALAIRVLLTACDIATGAALVGWLWPSGVMEMPLAAVSIPMLLRAGAATLLAMLSLGKLVAVWSSEAGTSASPSPQTQRTC